NIPEGDKVDVSVFETKAHHHTTLPEESPSSPSSPSSYDKEKMEKRTEEMTAEWNGKVDHNINMGTKPGLELDSKQVQVKAGSKVMVVFQNNDDMLHNLVVVEPGAAVEVGTMAMELGLSGQQKHYIPDSDKVLFHTQLL